MEKTARDPVAQLFIEHARAVAKPLSESNR
jgi:hypothetical protein